MTQSPKGHVDVLHGLWRTSRSMKKLSKALEAAGYTVNNVDYPSRSKPIRELALSHVLPKLKGNHIDEGLPRYVVGHSLGCILKRVIMKHEPLNNFQRGVMLGPPNGGNELADLLAHTPLGRWIFGPAIVDLKSCDDSYVNQLGEVDYPAGVIMGTSNVLPVRFLLPKDVSNDGVVTTASAQRHLSNACDYIEIPSTCHTFMMQHGPTIRQVLHYLDQGQFNKKQLTTKQ